jgi:hypothetical protein
MAGDRRRNKNRTIYIKQNLKDIQSRKENNGIPADLLRIYPKNANLPNPLKILDYHSKGR